MAEPRNAIEIVAADFLAALCRILPGPEFETNLGTAVVVGEPSPEINPQSGLYIVIETGSWEFSADYDDCDLAIDVEIHAIQNVDSPERVQQRAWAAVADIRKAIASYPFNRDVLSADAQSFRCPRRIAGSGYVVSVVNFRVRVAERAEYRV